MREHAIRKIWCRFRADSLAHLVDDSDPDVGAEDGWVGRVPVSGNDSATTEPSAAASAAPSGARLTPADAAAEVAGFTTRLQVSRVAPAPPCPAAAPSVVAARRMLVWKKRFL